MLARLLARLLACLPVPACPHTRPPPDCLPTCLPVRLSTLPIFLSNLAIPSIPTFFDARKRAALKDWQNRRQPLPVIPCEWYRISQGRDSFADRQIRGYSLGNAADNQPGCRWQRYLGRAPPSWVPLAWIPRRHIITRLCTRNNNSNNSSSSNFNNILPTCIWLITCSTTTNCKFPIYAKPFAVFTFVTLAYRFNRETYRPRV